MLHHVRHGSGEPLLLVHGLGMSWAAWRPVLDRLALERDVIAIDVPGFGASDPVAGEPTVPALADAVAAFAEEMGVQRPHVAGNSMGGGIALELGRTGRARSVTALSPVGFARGKDLAFAERSLRLTGVVARRLRPLSRVLAGTRAGRTLVGGQAFARPWGVPADAMAELLETVAAARSYGDARPHVAGYAWPGGELDVPATIAWGTRDRLLLPVQARRAREELPGATHVWLGGSGHLPMWDDPGQVARVLLDGSRAA